MIVFDVLLSEPPIGDKGDRMRLFLTEAGYKKALGDQGRSFIQILDYTKVSQGHLQCDRLDGLNDNALRQFFKRMLKSGDLARFDTGIYYLPKASRLLKKSYLDPMKVIIRKYIQSTTEISDTLPEPLLLIRLV